VAPPPCLACTLELHNSGSHRYLDTQHSCAKNPTLNNSTNGTEDASSTASAYTFDSYQDDAGTTAIYPEAGSEGNEAITYTVLGLIGEAGEIANKWKKFLRDTPIGISEADYNAALDRYKATIQAELGDVLWYCARLASELGTSLGEVAAANYDKLNDRKSRNVLRGSGDDR
jgi:NTP pyrophosphatase (non-canonical NTP hydrolase)